MSREQTFSLRRKHLPGTSRALGAAPTACKGAESGHSPALPRAQRDALGL